MQEFLVAEKIWNITKVKFTEKEGRNNHTIRRWEDALKTFWELLEHKPISLEVAGYLKEIVGNYSDPEYKVLLTERLHHFFNDLLKNQFFYKFDVRESKGNPFLRSLNCFFVYWQILSHLKEDVSWIENFSRNDFAKLLGINQIYNFSSLTYLELTYLELIYLVLICLELIYLAPIYLALIYLELIYLELIYLELICLELICPELFFKIVIPFKFMETHSSVF